MNRLHAIKQRLAMYTSADTNTDEKLENGAIAEWTFHSDGDAAWLLARVDELLEASEAALAYFDQCVMNCDPDDGEVEEAIKLRAAIRKAKA